MKTIKDIYKIGVGPSSSHTMGPQKAASTFNSRFPNAASFEVTLYGSLAATGKGHMTDKAILDTLQAPTEIVWKPDVILPFHPNGMLFKAFDAEKNLLGDWQVFSIGGGNLAEEGKLDESPEVYPLSKMTDILNWCEHSGRTYWEYVYQYENQKEIEDYMMEVWRVMKAAVERGIQAEGVLPGPLNLSRKAATYHIKASGYTHTLKSRGLVYSYALAVSEENASGGVIVTAPTCGSCGVMPAVLYHLSKSYEFTDQRIIRALVIIPSLAFAAYLVPGLWGAPVKAISAFAPPREIEGLEKFHDYEQGLAYARQENKPVIIDFTGYGCVNCRKMEDHVIDVDTVKTRLQNYVFIELFVDERHNGIGAKNSAIQREKYGSNAQPFYVQLDANGNVIADYMAFTTDPMEFINWLKY